jgi:hypothetical protein
MALQQNDVGTRITLTLKEDGDIVNISSASTKQIKVKKPSGETVTRTGSFTTDGTDGKLFCTIQASDLDEIGKYTARMYLVLGTWTGHSSAYRFDVDEAP